MEHDISPGQQFAHHAWQLDQEQRKLQTQVCKAKYFPTDLISFSWRLRHQALWHPHFQVECLRCKKSFENIEHIFMNCSFAQYLWALAEDRIGKRISDHLKLWNPPINDKPIWKHRIYIGLVRKALWDSHWKITIDKIESSVHDIEFKCYLNSLFYSRHFRK